MTTLSPNSYLFQETLYYPNYPKESKITGGFLCGRDSEEEFYKNYFQTEFSDATILQALQVHGNEIASLMSPTKVVEFLSVPQKDCRYDGLITDQFRHIVIIRTADCVPILFYSRVKPFIGSLHCGWKPLAANIIQLLSMNPHVDMKELCFFIGPAICQECYEVGEEVISRFIKTVPDLASVVQNKSDQYPEKSLLDLKSLARLLLIMEGTPDSSITISDICTRCHPDFNSYRENQTKERNINFITIN